MAFIDRRLFLISRGWKRKTEATPLANSRRLDPDPPTLHLDDPFHQRQADAGSLTCGIQLGEQTEDGLTVSRIDAAAVVADVEDALRAVLTNADLDAGRYLT